MASSFDPRVLPVGPAGQHSRTALLILGSALLSGCTLISPGTPPPRAGSTPLDPLLRSRNAAAEAAAAADAATRRRQAAVQQAMP